MSAAPEGPTPAHLPAPLDYPGFRALLRDEALPCALVDLDALRANRDTLLGLLGPGPQTLRLATKSLRLPAVIDALLAHPRIQGVMSFSARETLWLARHGVEDLLLGYPVGRPAEAELLVRAAELSTVRAMVDCTTHVELLAQAAQTRGTTLELCLEVDASARVLGRHAGVRRSPIRSPEAARALADRIRQTPGVQLAGLMCYEAVVAGMGDRNPTSRWLDPARALLKAHARSHVRALRAAVVRTLSAAGHDLALVNGGGTGSIASTRQDPSCTELTVGSGFFAPHLFDGYTDLPLRPAAFFALGVCRRSDPGFVTCFGGGYSASGEAGRSRLPRPHLPPGLKPLGAEGFGEVQTPFSVPADTVLEIGDPVICRHAKAGELMSGFDEVLLLENGRATARAGTYRGARHSAASWPFLQPLTTRPDPAPEVR